MKKIRNLITQSPDPMTKELVKAYVEKGVHPSQVDSYHQALRENIAGNGSVPEVADYAEPTLAARFVVAEKIEDPAARKVAQDNLLAEIVDTGAAPTVGQWVDIVRQTRPVREERRAVAIAALTLDA